VEGVCSAAGASGAKSYGFQAEGERDVGVRGGAEKSGANAEMSINGTDGGKQRRGGREFPGGTLADHSDGVRKARAGLGGMGFDLGTGLLDGAAEALLKFFDAAGIRGAEIDLEDGLLGNGVDGGSALDGTDVESGTRLDRQRDAEERIDDKGGGDDRVGSAVIAPGMAAGAGDDDLKAAAAERLGDDVVRACAIEGDEVRDGRRGGGIRDGGGRGEVVTVKVAHAAEVAFSFLAGIGDEKQRQGGDDADGVEGRGERPEGGETGAVVTDSGAEEAGVLAAGVKGSGGGKDGIKMGADGDGRGVPGGLEAGAEGEEVSGGVGGGGEAEGLKALAEPGGTNLLGKRGSGDRRNGELKIGDVAHMLGEPAEKSVDARVSREAIHLLSERTGGGRLGLPTGPGTERHFSIDGTRGGGGTSQKKTGADGEKRQRNRLDSRW